MIAEFHEALGAFMTRFTMIEGNLFISIRIMADISPQVLRVLLPNARANTAIDKTRQFLAISDQPDNQIAVVAEALDQLGHINAMRNSLLHHTLFDAPTGNGFLTTDALFTKSGQAEAFRNVSVETLRQMTDDLAKIYFRLRWWQHQILKRRGFTPEEPEKLLSQMERAQREPWRYKPVPPSTKNPYEADPGNTKAGQTPPESSPE
jgi:hypothetical protein